MKKNDLNNFIFIIIIVCIMWSSITSMIYAFVDPSRTQTEILLHIFKSFILDFK
jgi:hypothetical protein